jgi:hypothetical protein
MAENKSDQGVSFEFHQRSQLLPRATLEHTRNDGGRAREGAPSALQPAFG